MLLALPCPLETSHSPGTLCFWLPWGRKVCQPCCSLQALMYLCTLPHESKGIRSPSLWETVWQYRCPWLSCLYSRGSPDLQVLDSAFLPGWQCTISTLCLVADNDASSWALPVYYGNGPTPPQWRLVIDPCHTIVLSWSGEAQWGGVHTGSRTCCHGSSWAASPGRVTCCWPDDFVRKAES